MKFLLLSDHLPPFFMAGALTSKSGPVRFFTALKISTCRSHRVKAQPA